MLRAKKAKYKYKNTNAWLNAVYRNNKTLIDEKLPAGPGQSSKATFKQWVNAYRAEGNSPVKALRILSRSEIFTERSVRLKENFLKSLKQDKEAFKKFREKIGWKTKITPDNLYYDYKLQAYEYKGSNVIVRRKPSPPGGIAAAFYIWKSKKGSRKRP